MSAAWRVTMWGIGLMLLANGSNENAGNAMVALVGLAAVTIGTWLIGLDE